MEYNISDNNQKYTLNNYLKQRSLNGHSEKILKGLTSPQKYISSMFFYDDYGSELFEQITALPEYYPPRIEINLLKKISGMIKDELSEVDIVELGSGDCSKISVLLDSVSQKYLKTIRYLPLDVCQEAIQKSLSILIKQFPDIKYHGIVADFLTQLYLIPNSRKRIFCFFGSTIGNFSREKAKQLIGEIDSTMNSGDMLLLSFDMVKDKNIIEKAYNDSKGITAQFNLNILKVANKIAKTNFNTDDFQHLAYYNQQHSRIEMHLKAKKDINITCPYLDHNIILKEGETIHTENSYKFTNKSIQNLTKAGQFKFNNIFTDNNNWFSIIQIIKI